MERELATKLGLFKELFGDGNVGGCGCTDVLVNSTDEVTHSSENPLNYPTILEFDVPTLFCT